MKMEYYWYIFGAIPIVISIIGVIFCIVHGKGVSHKILVCFTSLWGVVFLICFGGSAVLSLFDMGWRCTPFNIMLKLCFILFVPILLCGIKVLFSLNVTDWRHEAIGVISMALALIIISISSWGYFAFTSFSDGLAELDNQTIVCASNSHGSLGERRYYIHINDLIHGTKITIDDWSEVRPLDYTS